MATVFEDNFTGEIKEEWSIISGDWEHNLEFNAYQISGIAKNKTKVDIVIPNNVLVECKIIKLNTLQNTHFDLLNRYSFDSNSGYSIAYVEVYSRLYDLALILFPWNNNSRGVGLDYVTWTELGLSGVADLEEKTIGIKCEGNVIKGYLDGVEILSVTDDTYSSGQTGLIANPNAESFIFDDFKIIGDNPTGGNNMSLYKRKMNPFTGTFDYVIKGNIVSFKEGVDTVGDLPSIGNLEGDARIANDNHHLYIWNGSAWEDQGDIIDIKWDTLEDKPTSTVENIDDAVDKKHDKLHEINNTLNHLGISGSGIEDNFMALDVNGLPKNSGKSAIDFANASHNHVESDITDLDHYTSEDFSDDFGLADLANLATKSYNDLTDKPDLSDLHFHDNKVELDLITDGDHDVRVDNPHIVTVDQLDLASGTVASDIDDAISKKHTQNTDTGTSNNFDVVGEISIKLYSQNDEPTLGQDNRMAIWIDTDDSNRVYLLYRRGVGDQVAVELA